MNNVYIRPFKKTDLAEIGSIEPDLGEFSSEMQDAIEQAGLAVTGTVDGQPIACGGVHPIDDFHGELWLRLSPWCVSTGSQKADTLLFLREAEDVICKEYPFKQLNATVNAEFKQSVRLIEFLGYEMTEEKRYDNKTYYVYSKRVK